MTRQDGLQN